jgi:hypothetical protein
MDLRDGSMSAGAELQLLVSPRSRYYFRPRAGLILNIYQPRV